MANLQSGEGLIEWYLQPRRSRGESCSSVSSSEHAPYMMYTHGDTQVSVGQRDSKAPTAGGGARTVSKAIQSHADTIQDHEEVGIYQQELLASPIGPCTGALDATNRICSHATLIQFDGLAEKELEVAHAEAGLLKQPCTRLLQTQCQALQMK